MRCLFLFIAALFALCSEERGWNSLELAKTYQENSTLQYTFAKELLKEISFAPDAKILDFGCGDGKITKELAESVPFGEVTGVDISSFMIEIAKEKFPNKLYPNLTFIQSSTETFSEISDMYDVITAFCVLHFVQDPVAILDHFSAHLKKGGKLLLTIPLRPTESNMEVANDCFAKYGLLAPWHLPNYSTDLSMRTIESAREKLAETGFRILYLEKIETPYIFPTRKSLIDWYVGTTSANWGIPFDIAHAFFNDYLDALFKKNPSMQTFEGPFFYKLPRIQIIAEKS